MKVRRSKPLNNFKKKLATTVTLLTVLLTPTLAKLNMSNLPSVLIIVLEIPLTQRKSELYRMDLP